MTTQVTTSAPIRVALRGHETTARRARAALHPAARASPPSRRRSTRPAVGSPGATPTPRSARTAGSSPARWSWRSPCSPHWRSARSRRSADPHLSEPG
ncbi:hypothetical protein NKG05_17025 [Oerskovia sp. M15]